MYPMPYEMAKLVQPGLTNQNNNAKPYILENADTSHLMKLFNFNIWAEQKVRTNIFGTLSDVIMTEVKKLEDHGFAKRKDFQVATNM